MSPAPESAEPPALLTRAITGAASGLGAALLLGILDAVGSADGVARQFDAPAQRLWFAMLVILAPAPVLMVWGAAQGAISHAMVAVSSRGQTGAGERIQRRWLGRRWALLAVPPVVWSCAQIFAGPRAQLIPGRRLLAAVLAVLAVGGANLAIQTVLRLRDWACAAPTRRQRLGRATGLALPVAGALVLLYLTDLRVLPRLYPWFHLSLQAALVLSAELVVMLLLFAAAPRRRSVGLLGLLGLALLSGGWAVHRLQRAQTLRGLALEHTRLVAQILRADSLLSGGPYRPPRPKTAPDPTADGDLFTPPPWSGPRLGGRDVFLITVDALRFDRISAATMPFVSSLLPGSAVFTRAYTQVPHTSFAIATLLTGKPVYALMTLGQDAGSHETLPLVLRRFRYKTAAFYPPSVFYVEHDRLRRLEESAYGFEYVKFEYLDAPRRTDQLIHFLEDEKPQRVFAWVHYLEPHEPYDPHPGGPDASRPDRERYDGEVRFIDDELRRLYGYLKRTRPSALLILAADHGEEFGEHGGRYHGTSLYEEQVHVPLIITDLSAEPGAGPVGPPRLPPQQLEQPVGLIDVAPTVLGLLDIEPSVRMRGHDLSPWLLARAKALPRWPVFSEIGRKKMVVRGDQKLICDFATDSCQAFDLQKDPLERRSILETAPASAAALRLALDRFIAEARRFEEAPTTTPTQATGATQVAERAAALARGRMGDRLALPVLISLATDTAAPLAERRAALTAVALLTATALPEAGEEPAGTMKPARPGDPLLGDQATRGRLRALFTEAASAVPADPTWLRAAALVRLRLSVDEDSATPASDTTGPAALQVVTTLLRDEHADAEQRLAAALVLFALPSCRPTGNQPPESPRVAASPDCVALSLTALPAAMSLDDPDRIRPLLLALGRSRDPRALAPLLSLVEPSVRSRPDLVRALGLLGQQPAVPKLAELLDSDPYVPVRAAAATALGQLGGPTAQTALRRAQTHEPEPQARAAITAALNPKP